jgi:hypothetical protein
MLDGHLRNALAREGRRSCVASIERNKEILERLAR